jgi:hypothetical protein
MEDDKRGDRNLAKAEAARRLACLQGGVFWIGTERTLTKRRSLICGQALSLLSASSLGWKRWEAKRTR